MLELVFFWGGFSLAVALLANRYGRSGLGWFVLSLILSPLVAVALVLALGKVQETGAR